MSSRSSAPRSPHGYPERLRDWSKVILFLWLIELADRFLFGNSLQAHGIHPRRLSHLEGLIFAPILHTTWSHLAGNSLSLLLLGAVLLTSGWRTLLSVSAAAAASGGCLVWLIGQSDTNHIGASSIVFGYLAFFLASGLYRPSPGTILMSLAVLLFYGSHLTGVLPTETIRAADISWEGHLGGALGGFLMARHHRRKPASCPKLRAR